MFFQSYLLRVTIFYKTKNIVPERTMLYIETLKNGFTLTMDLEQPQQLDKETVN